MYSLTLLLMIIVEYAKIFNKIQKKIFPYSKINHLTQGYKNHRKFIATQGPKQSTINDFWSMVWEQGSTIIIMLTNIKEKGKVCQMLEKLMYFSHLMYFSSVIKFVRYIVPKT